MIRKPSILVLDDEPDMLRALNRMLGRMGYAVHTETEADKALDRLRSDPPDILLTDLRLPGTDGIDVLRLARSARPELVVILMTAYATIETAVEAIKEGAYDYVPKPFRPDDLQEKIERALTNKFARERAECLQSGMQGGRTPLIGEAPAFEAVVARIQRIAGADASVLILGESGTGKEVVARAIHDLSPRREHDFIPLDCSSLSEQLLESELFGYERGAFTGADHSRPGLFEYADRGTMFLDEVGEVPAGLQSRLLRVLQDRSFRRVGGREERRVDARVLAATNADLSRAVEEGRFRKDLFYRLNCITVEVPPLRDRRSDIALLAHHFLLKHGRKASPRPPQLSPEALAALEVYDWPGNVRELENAILHALAFRPRGTIRLADLPGAVVPVALAPGEGEGEALEDVRRRIERAHILRILEENDWHRGRAAGVLKVSRKTLWEKMRTLGIR